MNTISLLTGKLEGYSLLDSGSGRRLEQFGEYILDRPDPQALWQQASPQIWNSADAVFEKMERDKGRWKILNDQMPEKWIMKYQNISFYCKLSPFKHTGVFPEQVAHWDWLSKMELAGKKILNLFAYTGIPTLILASKGAEVTHVDASYPTIGWARENAKLSGLEDRKVRWIQDDVIAFVRRELRRGSLYDGIIMDPPVLGHGPSGETWQFSKHFTELLADCVNLLSERPLFVIANAYAVSASSLMLGNMVEDILSTKGGKTESGELCLTESTPRARVFSTGIFARWER